MPTLPTPDDIALARRREIALQYLAMSRRDVEQATADMQEVITARRQHILNARSYGLSNQAIGDALGMTEAGVRVIVKATK